MGPIQNNKPITPPAQTPGAAPVTGPNAPKAGADFAVTPASAPAAGTVANAAAVAGSSLPALRTHIQAALKSSNNPEAVVRTVVERRVEEQFGTLATPQMKASVVEQLAADPHFVSTIHRLVREVSSSPT